MNCRLEILAYRARVHLGCSEEERAFPQEVEFGVRIQFAQAPAATRSDRLEDTLCYGSLCETIAKTAKAHPYRLIEALGREVYEALRLDLKPIPAALEVSVHKLHPPVENLRGGARFVYGDLELERGSR